MSNRKEGMGGEVIIACDFNSREETMRFLDKFGSQRPFVKIGMELYYACGPEIVRQLKSRGHRVFLDLKLHDIPNTVKKTMKVLSAIDVDMVNVHAAGGKRMMEAALEGLTREDGSRPLILAVTQLTSTGREMMNRELLIDGPVEDVVKAYGNLAKSAGIDGVVCSPFESELMHESCGQDFITVTPGVRLAGDDAADQVRVTTPAKAGMLGSDCIVVGRSITSADDPLMAYRKCIEEFTGNR